MLDEGVEEDLFPILRLGDLLAEVVKPIPQGDEPILKFHWWQRDLEATHLLHVKSWFCLPVLKLTYLVLTAAREREEHGEESRLHTTIQTENHYMLADVGFANIRRNRRYAPYLRPCYRQQDIARTYPRSICLTS